ncbi:MAG: pitrilysin family protein [Pseudomonadota bacterium]
MVRQALTGLFALAAAGAAHAETTFHDNVTQYTLDNGLDVVVIEDHRAPAVTHMLWYRVGAADEEPGVSGIAHFLEHLMFKGTETRAPGEFSDIVAANGGSDNAFTSWDYTGYFQRVAADRLPMMMEMEADRMTNLRLTEDQVAPERMVILEERSQRTDSDPDALFREQRRAAQYLNHPYGRPIIGWRHEMEELSREDALEFYERYYAPNNAILVVAGDASPEDVLALAEEHYGPIPANPDLPARVRPSEPPQLAERRLVMEDPRVAQPYVARSYLAPERDSGAQEQAAALVYLADLLGDGPATSYLGRKLQFEEGSALYTAAWYAATSLDDTQFSVIAVPAEGLSLESIEASLDAALASFLEEGVDSAHFERLKSQYAADAIYGRDNVDRLARRYGSALTAGLTVEDVQAWPDVLQAVTEEDVMEAARNVFDKRKSVTGWLTPPADAGETTEVLQ